MTKKPYKLDRVAIRMVKERPLLSDEPVNTPDSAVKLIQELLKDYDREIFAIVNLQTNLQPINMNIVSVGALNASLVHPREILKSVVLSNAASVMLIHNHPAGTMRPSPEDRAVTARMAELMNLMEVYLIDHKLLIIGDLLDRGKEAVKLQDFVLEQMKNDSIILVKGNHEDLYRELVTTDRGMPYGHHISNGTYDTVLQLTGIDSVKAQIKRYDFAEAGKDTPFYKEIMPAMVNYYETEHYVFTHGWIPCIAEKRGYSPISNWREAS